MDEGFVCPMCGTVVSASVSECPGCGEQFSPVDEVVSEPDEMPEMEEAVEEQPGDIPEPIEGPIEEQPDEMPEMGEEVFEDEPEYTEETVVEETDEIFVQEDAQDELPEEEEPDICVVCATYMDEEGICPTCQPPEIASSPSDGCPICGSQNYRVESGDLVSCTDCGNVYVHKDFEPEGQNWKWKFWVGLVFILVGNVGAALGSYLHNVVQWSPLGDMYLGYGWMDRMVGAIGIILFTVGLILFAWSFKREREVECPSCKLVIRESHFDIFEPEEEEEEVPKEDAIKSALDEIGEEMECPECGTSVSMFDASCGNCGAMFEIEFEAEESELAPVDDEMPEETAPDRLLNASEMDENEMIMESLEEMDEPTELEGLEELEFNGNGLVALQELDSALETSMEEGTVCPACGARIGKGLDTCPGCGEKLNGGE